MADRNRSRVFGKMKNRTSTGGLTADTKQRPAATDVHENWQVSETD
jgi:hypothetical protein